LRGHFSGFEVRREKEEEKERVYAEFAEDTEGTEKSGRIF
jgi:hypothetical protein